jgi:F0F1-type ATP synthase membrane subunit b/b'
MFRLSSKIVGIAGLVIVPIASAFASGDAHGAHSSPAALIPFWANFVVYALLMYFALRGKVRAGFSTRAEAIEKAVNKGRLELEQAKADLARAQESLSKVDSEIRAIGASVNTNTKNECAQIIADAEKKAQEVIARAQELAQAETRAFAVKLRHEVAEAVVAQSQEYLRRGWTPELDRARREQVIGEAKDILRA